MAHKEHKWGFHIYEAKMTNIQHWVYLISSL